MKEFVTRNLTADECAALERTGSRAEDWSKVRVATDFNPSQVSACRFEGCVEIGSGAVLADSRIANYRIGERAEVRSVVALECRHASSFGCGVEVAAVNENGGRAVTIFDELTAQIAYMSAMYRHRPQLVQRITEWATKRAEQVRSELGCVGCESRIVGAKFIREARIGERVTIEGASMVENATLLDECYVGVDVKMRDTIAVEHSHIDTGATLERCFVGERVVLADSISAVDSLFFANSHCERGECCSIFAGPYTVSHHKSSLLIAGIFSFFNGGSGTNQSNHLFKSGAVHQAVHRRGCRFGSNAYVMAPAAEGAFTTVIGRHTHHHDTSALPLSYLIEEGGTSTLLPGFALRNYGTLRDVQKWPQRDRRTVRREPISFDEYNPMLASQTYRAAELLRQMKASDPEANRYSYNNCLIKPSMLISGIKLYTLYAEAAVGAMLDSAVEPIASGVGAWVDCGGQYLPQIVVERIINAIEEGRLSAERCAEAFAEQHTRYASLARGWAEDMLHHQLGHAPSDEECKQAIARGKEAHATLRRYAEADCEHDCSGLMQVGYGTDSDSTDDCASDFRTVRGV